MFIPEAELPIRDLFALPCECRPLRPPGTIRLVDRCTTIAVPRVYLLFLENALSQCE